MQRAPFSDTDRAITARLCNAGVGVDRRRYCERPALVAATGVHRNATSPEHREKGTYGRGKAGMRLLDLYCGGGGAAMGYSHAGFDHIVGVDIAPQKHYPFAFVQADALEYLAKHGQEYDVVHCSPPCQAYSALKHFARPGHPELIDATREALQRLGKPYVIENVVGAPLRWPLMLCGSMFDLTTPCGAQLRRHRLFESDLLLMSPGHCRHGERTLSVNGHEFRNEKARWAERQTTDVITVSGDHPHNPRLWRAEQRRIKTDSRRTIMVVGGTPRDPVLEKRKYHTITITGGTPQQNVLRNQIRETFTIDEARYAMGIDWIPMRALSQAIPPAYTQWIGSQLLQHLSVKERESPME